VEQDSEEKDEEGDEECIQAVRITKEFWGPESGRHKFDQRLFRVLFSDGSVKDCVAEDVKQVLTEPFESNQFYADVLRHWRTLHLVAPTWPLSEKKQ